jgi:hypothetical protein
VLCASLCPLLTGSAPALPTFAKVRSLERAAHGRADWLASIITISIGLTFCNAASRPGNGRDVRPSVVGCVLPCAETHRRKECKHTCKEAARATDLTVSVGRRVVQPCTYIQWLPPPALSNAHQHRLPRVRVFDAAEIVLPSVIVDLAIDCSKETYNGSLLPILL